MHLEVRPSGAKVWMMRNRNPATKKGNVFKVAGAYNYMAEYMPEREKMMQWWADYLDEKRRADSSVVLGNFGRRNA